MAEVLLNAVAAHEREKGWKEVKPLTHPFTKNVLRLGLLPAVKHSWIAQPGNTARDDVRDDP